MTMQLLDEDIEQLLFQAEARASSNMNTEVDDSTHFKYGFFE